MRWRRGVVFVPRAEPENGSQSRRVVVDEAYRRLKETAGPARRLSTVVGGGDGRDGRKRTSHISARHGGDEI